MIPRSANKEKGIVREKKTRRELKLFTFNRAAGKRCKWVRDGTLWCGGGRAWQFWFWLQALWCITTVAVRNRNVVTLASDVLLVFSWSLALIGLVFRYFNLSYVLLHYRPLSLSEFSSLMMRLNVMLCPLSGWQCWESGARLKWSPGYCNRVSHNPYLEGSREQANLSRELHVCCKLARDAKRLLVFLLTR